MTIIETVRLKTSDKSTITREVAVGDGASIHFKLKNGPIISAPVLQVRVNNILLVEITDYTVDLANGIVSFVGAPAINSDIEFTYYWSIFTDAEIQQFLDESGENTTIAAARVLLAWAADAAKVAKRQTLSGGGGLGQVVIDTSVVSKELRASAVALLKFEQDLGESVPYDALTEIPWTEAYSQRQRDQHLIRES